MKKVIGFAAIALLVAGCSGSDGGSTSGSSGSTGSSGQTSSGGTGGGVTLTGALGFPVRKSVALFASLPDGGLDPTFLEIDFSDDATDSCAIQEQGYDDGGYPDIAHFGELIISDPSGVQTNTPYNSVTAEDLAIHAADGGGVPAGGFIQAFVFTSTTAYTSVGGSATVTSISNSSVAGTLNSVTMAYPDGGSPSTLSGSVNVTDQSCMFQLQPQ